MLKKYLITIVGPTAVGKTSLSIQIAQKLNTEIISADSRQLFKEISIGTAAPTLDEMQGIRHHFIASHSIHQNYNAGLYEKEAIELIEKLFKSYNYLILVGGSGLYIDAICNGFDALPTKDEKTRKYLEEKLQNEGIICLQNQLKKNDPVYFEKVDKNNPHRLIRALEVCLSTQKPYSSFLKNSAKNRSFTTIKIGLEVPRTILYEKINQRVLQMIENGWINETKPLLTYKHLNSLNTVGYKELIEFLENKVDLNNTIKKIQQKTRNFAKRQLTWFKKDKNTTWFLPSDTIQINLLYPKIPW